MTTPTKPNNGNTDYDIPTSWGGTQIRPTNQKIFDGFGPLEKPLYSIFNWFISLNFKWMGYFRDTTDLLYSDYVSKSGDTMTGYLEIPNGTSSGHAINKSQLDTKSDSGHTHNTYIRLIGDTMTGNLLFSGGKTIKGLKAATANGESARYDEFNAHISDSTIHNTGVQMVIQTGVISHGGTIPLPDGYTQEQCKWFVTTNSSWWYMGRDGHWNGFQCYADANRVVTCTAWTDTLWEPGYGEPANYIIIGVK